MCAGDKEIHHYCGHTPWRVWWVFLFSSVSVGGILGCNIYPMMCVCTRHVMTGSLFHSVYIYDQLSSKLPSFLKLKFKEKYQHNRRRDDDAIYLNSESHSDSDIFSNY